MLRIFASRNCNNSINSNIQTVSNGRNAAATAAIKFTVNVKKMKKFATKGSPLGSFSEVSESLKALGQ